jgi:hypothetical protein
VYSIVRSEFKVLFRYDVEIDGTLCAFDPDSMKPIFPPGENSTTLRDGPGECYIHITIECIIILFCPKPGDYVVGVCQEERGLIYLSSIQLICEKNIARKMPIFSFKMKNWTKL